MNLHGSFLYTFSIDPASSKSVVQKGSVCVNGVSLTVVEAGKDFFSVAIIPYTFENTNFKDFKVGTKINLEFDVVGKYISRLYAINK